MGYLVSFLARCVTRSSHSTTELHMALGSCLQACLDSISAGKK
jgi:hypothetical protein